MKFSIILLIIPIGSLVNACSTENVVQPLFECTNKLDNPYGIVSHISRSGPRYEYEMFEDAIRSLEELGINCIRTDLDCGNITPVGLPSTTERFDKLFTSASQIDFEICGILTNLKYNLRCWDDYPSYWRYVDTLLIRYNNKLNVIEILNEVDRYKDADAVIKYVNLLCNTYVHIKKQNPKIKVVFGGISWSKTKFLPAVMKKEAYNYFDIMNFHVYDDVQNLPEHIMDIRKNMDDFGWNKHVWITEMGYSTCIQNKDGQNFIVTEGEQAKKLPSSILTAFAYGIDKVFWYCHCSCEIDMKEKEDCFGIVHANFSPKLSFMAYKTLIKMCPNGSTRPRLRIRDGINEVSWKQLNGEKFVALWTYDIPKFIRKTDYDINYAFDIFGKRKDISNGFFLTDSIIYLNIK